MTERLIVKQPSRISRYRKTGIYLFIGITLVLMGVAVWQRQAIYDQLYSWKLIPHPERITELYFAEHTKLPHSYTVDMQQTVRFTVHNIEYRPTTYKYTITQENQDSTIATELAAGRFTLAHDRPKTISTPITLTRQGVKSRIVVTINYSGIAFGQDFLSQQKQAIYYWMTKGGKRP